MESIEKNRKCKSEVSSGISDYQGFNSSGNITEVKNNFRTISDYRVDMTKKYFEEFKKSLKKDSKTTQEQGNQDEQNESDIFAIQNEFIKKFPYISGKKTINKSSIKIPTKQYFMNNLFNRIISLFDDKKAYLVDNKYGLVYFRQHEWIFFTIEDFYYQQYLEDSNKIMTLLYNDYSQKILNAKILFTEDDNYVLPSNVRAKIFEKNAFNYFLLKTKLKSAPDLLIKLENKKTKVENKSSTTFHYYIEKIKKYFDYLEIDGALINDTKEERNIEIEKPILAYEAITYENNICEIDNPYNKNKKISIPAYSVVFFQTKIKGPNIKLNNKNFDITNLTLNEMKEELAAVIYKMILYNDYFYDLYIKLGLIDENYKALFFLIFDDYPISDISTYIKDYLDIFIKKKLLNYDFRIQPFYMSMLIEDVNSQLNMSDLNNNYQDINKKYNELIKQVSKLTEQKQSEKLKEDGEKKKEEEEKKEEIIKSQNEIKNEEVEIRRKENELKSKEEEIKKRKEELKMKKDEEEELMRKRENELKKKEDEIKKKEEEIRKNEEETKKKEEKLREEIMKGEKEIKNREEELNRRENQLTKLKEEIIQKEEVMKMKKEEEEKIKKRENELKIKEEEILKKREEEMVKREKILKEKEEEIKIKIEEEEEKIKKRENELKIKEEEILKKREEEMVKREKILKEKEEEIKIKKEEEEKNKKRENELKKREEEMVKREKILKEKEEEEIKECDNEADNIVKKIRSDVERIVSSKFKKYKLIGYNYKLVNNNKHYSFKVKIEKNKYIHILKKGQEINVIFGKKLFDPF